MTDQIVSRAQMRERGQEAFAAGRGRDDHNMNLGAAGVSEWQAGWDYSCVKHVQRSLGAPGATSCA